MYVAFTEEVVCLVKLCYQCCVTVYRRECCYQLLITACVCVCRIRYSQWML